jgi:ABC-type uncharacterized transport system permease subunit
MIVIAIFALLFYLLAIIVSLRLLLSPEPIRQGLLPLYSTLALLAHTGVVITDVIDAHSGQNMSILNVAALVSLIISALMSAAARRYHGWVLLPVVYSFSILLLTACALIPSQYITHLEAQPSLLLHIGLALIAYSLLMMAGLFALQLAYLDRQLKSRTPRHYPTMPPLLTLEARLFQLLATGLCLLTPSLASGLLMLNSSTITGQSHKLILSMIAWCIYALLLWGHHAQGWRGRKVITLSLIGNLILTLAYFGNRLVNEVLVY